MPFLRIKKGSKSNKVEESTVDSNDARGKAGMFSRKKKKALNSSSAPIFDPSDFKEALSGTDETSPAGPSTTYSIASRGVSLPSQRRTRQYPQSGGTVTSQTTTSTTIASTNNSSVGALLHETKSGSPKARSNALQNRQLQHLQMQQRLGGENRGRMHQPIQQPVQAQQLQQKQQQQQQPIQQQRQNKSQNLQPNTKPQEFVAPTALQTQSSAQTAKNPEPIMPPAVPMTRSGWSVLSAASTAMNSAQYIESLNDLSSSPVRTKAFPILNSQPDEGIRLALSRPFGRSSHDTHSQKWEIIVESPNWDANEGRYKYRINVLKLHNDNNSWGPRSSYGRSMSDGEGYSLNGASTTRSLQDFVWLERALRAEYQGAMLVPLLSLALYFESSRNTTGEDETVTSKSLGNASMMSEGSRAIPPDGNIVSQSIGYLEEKMDKNEPVEISILSNWLSDIFNGVRGNGELFLTFRDVAESEAVETFLFRHAELLKEPSQMGSRMGMGLNPCRASTLGSPFNLFSVLGGDREDGCNKSLFDNFLENPFACFGSDNNETSEGSERTSLAMICSSGATGIEGCNDNVSVSTERIDFAGFQLSSSAITTHSELLEAERDLIASYIRCSTAAMKRVHSLIKDEAYVGQCWERFAVTLSNLFSVEKDLETAHIGDQIKCSKKNMPFRKLRKAAVDDGLRVLARGKIDRSKPSLLTLRSMLNAYYADLNSVVPAFKEYRDAINQLHELNEMASVSSRCHGNWNSKQAKDDDWMYPFDSLRAFTSNIAKHIAGQPSNPTVRTNDSDATSEEGMYSLNTTQSKAFQTRVRNNERALKYSITSLCKACPLRTARMAWWFLKLEVKQASNVHAAALALRQTLSIDADTAIAMKERNYEEVESKDNDAEIELVKRLLDLGVNQDNVNKGDYADIEVRRQSALRMAIQRVGRWNAETALAIMEAAGVEDAEVQMDETSRELRHVRKFAISLRESVVRCREAAESLAEAFAKNPDSSLQIARSRREFWAAISTVFSGRLLKDDGPSSGFSSTRVLTAVGININDKGGWLGHGDESKNQRRRSCGEVARRYLRRRDYQVNILLSRVLKLLREYEQRLEGIESFVYMHCVGIQLEKHCSKVRAKALSAWEKRTDISTAINVATKKRIPKLVQELKIKLDALPQVSHTTVIKAKESHLASKTLKSDLHKLANRRFGRAQEVSTERVIAIMSLWAKHEESVAIEEVRALGEAVNEVELSVESEDLDVMLDRHPSSSDTKGLQTGSRYSAAAEVRTSEGRSLLM